MVRSAAVSEPTQPPGTDQDVDEDLIDYLLTLTPAERVRRMLGALELVKALRKAVEEKARSDDLAPPPSR